MRNSSNSWAIVLHGGASEVPAERQVASRNGCLAALQAGRAILAAEGSAIAAVEAATRVLEDDPTFNAGYGSVLNSRGEVEMDASIMDGATLDVGAVAAIRGVRNPVSVARELLRELPILLVGEGAREFAQQRGAQLCDPSAMISPARREAFRDRGHDTVGCVARDVKGHIATALSTGGLKGKFPGRVGDSPVVGGGFYAADALGGVAFSGDGESIARVTLASRVIQQLNSVDPQTALEQSLKLLAFTGGEAGGIAIDRHGRIGWAHTSPHFAVAYATSADPRNRVFLERGEDQELLRYG
jgi:L-asparaginase / beta-aspartyl-peptidase